MVLPNNPDVALNPESLLAKISGGRILELASCEMTRPANTTPYSSTDAWTDSDTYNPSPFVFQFPLSWANTIAYPYQIKFATNNNVASPQFTTVWCLNGYPPIMPLDNTVFVPKAWDYRASFFILTTAFAVSAAGAADGKLIISTANAGIPGIMLDGAARMYLIVRTNAYTPLASEKLYIEILATRHAYSGLV